MIIEVAKQGWKQDKNRVFSARHTFSGNDRDFGGILLINLGQ